MHALTRRSSVSSVSGRNGGTRQNKTNEETQAKKKELGRAALRGGALEAGLECSRERGGGTWKL